MHGYKTVQLLSEARVHIMCTELTGMLLREDKVLDQVQGQGVGRHCQGQDLGNDDQLLGLGRGF